VSRKTRKKQVAKTAVRRSWWQKIPTSAILASAFAVLLLAGLWLFGGRLPEWFDKSKSLLSAAIFVAMLAVLIRFRTQTTK
jgi:protein-S-isoprenylcysteine O-methyltransferase Ste14